MGLSGVRAALLSRCRKRCACAPPRQGSTRRWPRPSLAAAIGYRKSCISSAHRAEPTTRRWKRWRWWIAVCPITCHCAGDQHREPPVAQAGRALLYFVRQNSSSRSPSLYLRHRARGAGARSGFHARDGPAVVVAPGGFVAAGWRFFQWAIVYAHWSGSNSDACPSDGGACWAFIVARWKPWLVGDYPSDQLWRAWACFLAFALFWTWVVRRSHEASMQRVLLGFIALPAAFFLLLAGGGPLPAVAPTRWGGLLLTLVVTLATFATRADRACARARAALAPAGWRWLCAPS